MSGALVDGWKARLSWSCQPEHLHPAWGLSAIGVLTWKLWALRASVLVIQVEDSWLFMTQPLMSQKVISTVFSWSSKTLRANPDSRGGDYIPLLNERNSNDLADIFNTTDRAALLEKIICHWSRKQTGQQTIQATLKK